MKQTGTFRAALLALVLVLAARAFAQAPPPPSTDVLGVHDLSAGSAPLRGANANACMYCHTPHRGISQTPLWNQTLSTKQYTLNPNATGTPTAPATVSQSSMLCLSCHDGSTAVGSTVSFGTLQMTGALTANLGTNLEGSHPFSIQPQLKDAPSLVSTLAASHTTKNPEVKLVNDNVECSTCHDVHNQYKDRKLPKFLVRENASGALCLSCHDVGARTVNSRDNTLTGWPTSIHATSTAAVAAKAGMGGYANVGEFACLTCHSSHGALGASLMRKNVNSPPNMDNTSQACVTCHDGSDNLAQPILNVLATMNTPGQFAHPYGDSNNQHTTGEAVVVDDNRHATCADCHAAHSTQQTTAFAATPNLRPSQNGVAGVSAAGVATNTAIYQYENCLRCHGTSTKKQSLSAYGYMPARGMFAGDTLDVSLQFSHNAVSSHPVMRDATNLARPSLLPNMWNETFSGPSRPMSTRLLCTDCHNSEANREFGGAGPNGPHGSSHEHILEREYIMSRVGPGALPGTTIVNLNTPVNLNAVPTAPYALCAKCHDLNYINSGASWSKHSEHINRGFSCSVCHSAHGVPAGTAGGGPSLVSFDLNVVGPAGTKPISYNGGTSCTLRCHDRDHGN